MELQKIEKLKAQVAENPYDAAAWFDLGQEYFTEEFAEAARCFTRCISLDPFNSDYYYNRGRMELSLNEFERALADLVMSVRLDTKTDMKWHYCGVAYFYTGLYYDAAETFQRSVETSAKYGGGLVPPSTDWTWMAYMKSGHPEKAESVLSYVTKDTKVGYEDRDYKTRVLLYKGEIDPEEFYANREVDDDLVCMAETYGLCNYYYYVKHDVKRSLELMEEVLAFKTWHHAFAYKSALMEIDERRAEAAALENK